MRTLVIANRKGGVGKTTLSGHLGVMAEQSGEGPVALIDTDPSGNLASWWNVREVETPVFAQVEMAKLKTHLKQLEKAGVKLAIIDTPAGHTEAGAIRAVMEVADLVLIPTRASPHDLRSVAATVELAEKVKRRIVFVINGAAARAKITAQAAISLSQHGTVSPVILYQRTDFASSMINGRTAQEIDAKGNSAAEIEALWKYVSTQINK